MIDPSTLNLASLEQQYGLPPGLLSSVMKTESGGNPAAVSPKGALGLFQFLPDTAKQYGIDPNDPQQAAQGAAHMYGDLISKYGDLPSALAAYNWGQGNVDRKGLANAPDETKSYISKVMAGVGNFIVPSANASEMPTHDLSHLSDDQLQQIATPDQSQQQPNLGHLSDAQLEAIAGQNINDNALASLTNNDTSLPARLTAYGANAASQIPGLKEGGSALAALFGAGEGGTFGDRYNSLEAAQAAMRKAGQQVDPGATTLGDLSGNLLGLGLGGKLAGTAGEQLPAGISSALGEFATSHPYLSGVAASAPVGAIYGAANGTDTASRTSGAAVGGALSSLASIPLTYAARNVVAPLLGKFGGSLGSQSPSVTGNPSNPSASAAVSATSQDPEALKDISENLYTKAGDLYKQMRTEGAVFTPEKSQGIAKSVEDAINKNEFIPELNPKTTAIVNKIKQVASDGNLGLDQLDQYRRLLGRVGGSEDGVSANAVRSALDKTINGAESGDLVNGSRQAIDLLNQGRAQYAQASRFDTLSNLINKAEGNPYKIQTALKTFVKNDSNLSGFSSKEIAALKNASKNGIGGSFIKFLGKFGFSADNVLTPSVAAFTGAGAPLAAVGTIARPISKAMTRSRIDNALQTVLGQSAQTPQIPFSALPGVIGADATSALRK